MTIAVDFDGTIVKHKYPAIGKDMLFAFETLNAMQKAGHLLILWTYRSGKELDEAVEYCRKKGVEFYAVNKSYPEEVFNADEVSRKVNADLFIDDRNVGGFYGWGEIWQELNLGNDKEAEKMRLRLERSKRNSFCNIIKSIFCNQ
ncbi:hydrolase [Labilibacter sediminis]|nr:hydrolase [Labilibacter sediminis]